MKIKKEKLIAYKGFKIDEQNRLYCDPDDERVYFEVGKTYSVEGNPVLCQNGFHYCMNLNDVHNFYNLSISIICEIEILGEFVNSTDFKKSCSNKIKILRILTKEQVLNISNTGKDNSGFINSGDYNSGDYNSGNRNSGNYNSGDYNSGYYNSGYYNSGDYNSGNRNSGNYNSGYYNSGDYNSGDYNSGNYNSGDYNSGYYNSGYYNSGDYNSGYYNSGDYNSGYYNSGNYNSGYYNSGNYNSGDYSNGFFNTKEHEVFIFDQPSNMTFSQFKNSKYFDALTSEPLILTEWTEYTDHEKKNDKSKELIGGYLKRYEYKEACQTWWNKLTKENKKIIVSIPNFDAEIFEKITGINIAKK